MAIFRSSNPMLRNAERARSNSVDFVVEECTYQGVMVKTGVLALLALVTASIITAILFGMIKVDDSAAGVIYAILILSGILSFLCVLIATLIPKAAMPFSILYSVFEGALLGAITSAVQVVYPGLPLMALIITFTIFAVMLILYKAKIIRVGKIFRKVMSIGMLSLLVFFIIVLISRLFTQALYDVFYADGPIAILLCVVLIGFGTMMLIFDFDRVDQFVYEKADKKYEWMLALGLMLSIVWIYIEVLRLLQYIARKK